MAESEEELKSLLMRVKEFKKLRSWHLVPSLHGKDGEKMETERDFISLDSKISADGDCTDFGAQENSLSLFPHLFTTK